MLRYLGRGKRQFRQFPVKPLARMNWEFFAVVAGRCAPLHEGQATPRLRERTLWVFPPGSAHSWAGAARGAATIAVFHFGSVPPLLATAVREHGFLELPLQPAECDRLVELAARLEPDFNAPTLLSNLLFQGSLLELALLALGKLPHQKTPLAPGHAKLLVERATTWYTDHIRANPSIDEVARRLSVSASTLRRAFQRAVRERPVRVFARIQLEAAMRLLTETTLKLDTIAVECGFSSTSDFCRAFRAHTKVTPSVWRRTILAPPKAAVAARSRSGR